jgi:hypothetical protein
MAKRTGKKRRVSAKVLEILRKGRMKMMAKRKGKHSRKKSRRHVPEQLENIVIEGGTMLGRKKRRHHKRKYSGAAGELFGRKRRHHRRKYSGAAGMAGLGRRKRRHYSGMAGGGSGMKGAMGGIMDGVLVAGGAVGGSLIAKFVPIQNAKIKAIVPLALGLGIGFMKIGKKPLFHKLAVGSTAIGILALAKSFVPTLPLLAGDELMGDEYMGATQLTAEERAMLGDEYQGDVEYSSGLGAVEDFGGGDEYMGDVAQLAAEDHKSPADL